MILSIKNYNFIKFIKTLKFSKINDSNIKIIKI